MALYAGESILGGSRSVTPPEDKTAAQSLCRVIVKSKSLSGMTFSAHSKSRLSVHWCTVM